MSGGLPWQSIRYGLNNQIPTPFNPWTNHLRRESKILQQQQWNNELAIAQQETLHQIERLQAQIPLSMMQQTPFQQAPYVHHQQQIVSQPQQQPHIVQQQPQIVQQQPFLQHEPQHVQQQPQIVQHAQPFAQNVYHSNQTNMVGTLPFSFPLVNLQKYTTKQGLIILYIMLIYYNSLVCNRYN